MSNSEHSQTTRHIPIGVKTALLVINLNIPQCILNVSCAALQGWELLNVSSKVLKLSLAVS